MTPYRCSMYNELYAWLAQRHITPAGYELALYHNYEFVEQNIDMELGVVVSASATGVGAGRVAIAELPAATLASVTHHGAMWDIPQALIALGTWLSANQLTATGSYREIHLFGHENDQHDYNNIVLELQVPIAIISD